MKRLHMFLLILLASAPLAAQKPGQWAMIRGHWLYYETRGEGRPLLLLHGGGDSIQSSFASQLQPFSLKHRVIAPEQVGHGHTADVPGPISYTAMAEDTAALLEQLHVKDADVVGWSDGGNIALVLALRHPDLVRRIVVSGANFAPEGLLAEDLKQLREKVAKAKGAAAQTFQARLNRMWLTSPTPLEISPALLKGLRKKVLVMGGDRDAVRLEHLLALYKALPEAALWILPGTTHGTLVERPEWVNPMILAFFEGD